jgi:RND family efflux transporter MFP subunit
MIPRAAALLPFVLALLACSNPDPDSDPGTGAAARPGTLLAGAGTLPAGLETAVAELAEVPRETAFDGRVEAINQATVSAQTAGRVVELPYDVGDYVEKDAVIARFTTSEQRARAEAAEAVLAEARARLAEARLAHDRIGDLHGRKLVARADLDRATADLDTARARAEAARAAVDEAREGLSHTVIRAPYAGIVVTRHAQIGETVSPGTPLMTGLSLEHLRVAVDVPQQHIGPLRRERQARAILPEGGSLPVAELRIPPGADPDTHSFRVLATLPPGEHGIFPGTLLRIAFVSGSEQRLLIPAQALARRGEVTGAYVVGTNDIAFRHLRVGTPTADGRIPVLAGLAAGERIALDPVAAAIAYRGRHGGHGG